MDKKNNEQAAIGLVKLYVEQIARLGLKRKLDLDSIISAYLYTLARLDNKSEEMKIFDKLADSETEEVKSETKEEVLKEFV